MHLSKIKPVHIQKIYTDLTEKGLTPKSISNIQGMFYDLMKIAVKNDLIIKNPCAGVTIPKVEKTKRRVLTAEEQAKAMNHLKHDDWKHLKPMVTVILGAGMRIGEILGLTWADVDFEGNGRQIGFKTARGKAVSEGMGTKVFHAKEIPVLLSRQ